MACMRMGAEEWLLLIILSMMWGGSFLFMGILVRELPPLTIAASRLLIAALLLNAIFRSELKFLKLLWKEFMILGLINNTIPYALILWAQLSIPSSLASILNSTSPFFTSIMAHFLTDDEKLTIRGVIGILIGFSGVSLMLASDAIASTDLSLSGQLAVISAVACYSYATIYGRRFYGRGLSATAVASGQLNSAAMTAIPLALAIDRPWNLSFPSLKSIAAIMGLSVISTALAYLIFFRVLQTSGATNVNLVTLMIPVTATFLCAAFLGERLEVKHAAGMLAISLGLVIADGRPLGWMRQVIARACPRFKSSIGS